MPALCDEHSRVMLVDPHVVESDASNATCMIAQSSECLGEQGDVIELHAGAGHNMASMSCGRLSSPTCGSPLQAGVGTLPVCARTRAVEVEEEG